MPFDCHGPWMSWIKPKSVPSIQDLPLPPSDGIIFVEPEDASGKFSGKHLGKNLPIHGQCEMGPHRITFTMVDGSNTLIYRGDITLDAGTGVLVARGRRMGLFGKDDRLELLDDDEWVGVKTT